MAEFGFFGVVAYTRVHTPRFCGEAPRAGTLVFSLLMRRGFAINWLVVAMLTPELKPKRTRKHRADPCFRGRPGRFIRCLRPARFGGGATKAGDSRYVTGGCQRVAATRHKSLSPLRFLLF